MDKVQQARDLMRVFLTVWFSLNFSAVLGIGIYGGNVDMKEGLLAVTGILGTVMGYHFGKSSKKDETA